MSITVPPCAISVSSLKASGNFLGQLRAGPGFILIHRVANPCKNPRHDVSKPLHEGSSCPQTGARHEEHRPPGFPAFHAYGVQ